MNFLYRLLPTRRVAPIREVLVSVHIPKTAGTSFRQYLKQQYGKDAVIRLDMTLDQQRIKINEQPYAKNELPPGIKAIHGHFNPVQLGRQFDFSVHLRHITWLRHPVDRVISNYFYLKKRLAEELDEPGKGLNILSKMQRTLMEYASDEVNRNRQSKFLAGMPLSQFDFVGIQEHYNEDVAAMAKEFRWDPAIEVPKYNVTGGKRQVSDADREAIAELNAADMALYEEGLRLRQKRQGAPKIDLLSIHITKTGGSSFQKTLEDAYGNEVTDHISRFKYNRLMERYGSLLDSMNGNKRAIHGHLYYPEVAHIHREHGAKVICWLRDPIERVVSNFHYFKGLFTNPNRGPRNYRLNRHRKNEDLLTYARRDDTRNRMTKYLAGIELEELFFIGFLEDFDDDLAELGRRLDWPPTDTYRLNVRDPKQQPKSIITAEVRQELEALNAQDVALYAKAKQLWGKA